MRDTLKTERLILRPLRPEDAGPISLYAADLNVSRMLARVPHPYPPGAAEAFIERALSGQLMETVYAIAFAASETHELVGVVGLRERGETNERRLGYWLGAPAWGRGVATEAVRAVVDEGFADLALARITSDVFLDNLTSRRVLEKTGFVFGNEFEQFCPARNQMAPSQHCTLARVKWAAGRGG